MKGKKSFLITIDTEGDNLWAIRPKQKGLIIPETKNANYLERFQILCEKYNFKPTYLVDYEMVNSYEFKVFARDVIKRNKGEIGMHMHAFSNPPFFELSNCRGGNKAYAGEYPFKIIYEKTEYLTKMLQDEFQIPIRTHRGGRWYLDNRIIRSLDKLGYKVDCTVTPGVDWTSNSGQVKGSHGKDYSLYKNKKYIIRDTDMIELPVTILKKMDFDYYLENKKMKNVWFRPTGENTEDMLWILNNQHRYEFLEFMLHSSELMPGGSHNFINNYAIEKLYEQLEIVFAEIYKRGYMGCTCSEYWENMNGRKI